MKKMLIDKNSGQLTLAYQQPSPNYNERPDPTDIELLVIHNISLPPGQYGDKNIQDFFCNRLDYSKHPYFLEIKDLCVAPHLLIKRDGEIVQFVPFHKRAWHAGRSIFEGRIECNDYSIGIELEGDDETPYTDMQYAALVEVTQCIMHSYPTINKQRIVGHQHIAPNRKTDPGSAFDWQRYLQKLAD